MSIIAENRTGMWLDLAAKITFIPRKVQNYEELIQGISAYAQKEYYLAPIQLPQNSIVRTLDKTTIDRIRVGISYGIHIPVIAMLKDEFGIGLEDAIAIIREVETAQVLAQNSS